ncbi:MAG: Uncharacterized protein AUK64_2073 [bacterium P201]|nr:MAG: Uncharacterized protein AUK64_2073 [bacterium P201]
MNIIQTFYSYKEDSIHDNAGFLTPDMNWKSMALSCLLLKRHFKEVTLYCNHRVKNVIIDKLKIPYDNIIEVPDFMEEYKECNLWALPKIYTYSLQHEPFLHVDCDWFMFEKLSDSILEADVFGQNIEYDDQMYNRHVLEKLISNGCVLPSLVIDEYKQEKILRVVNAGILGGNDIPIIQKYVGVIFDFINDNKTILQELNDGFVNSIYEQLFFYLIAQKHHCKLGLCTKGDYLSTKFDWLPIDFTYSPKSGYMHLLANLKRKMNSYVFVSQYLSYLSPDLSERITKVCFENGIFPLINFPEWDVYNPAALTPAQLSNNFLSHIDDEGGKEISTIRPCTELEFNPIVAHTELQRNTHMLWNISSLWSSKYKIELSSNIRIYEISHEQAVMFVKQRTNRSSVQISNKDKIYLVYIPDTMLMKVISVLVWGIKINIIEFLRVAKTGTLHDIGDHLANELCFPVNNHGKKILDRTIRSMIVNGILRFSS